MGPLLHSFDDLYGPHDMRKTFLTSDPGPQGPIGLLLLTMAMGILDVATVPWTATHIGHDVACCWPGDDGHSLYSGLTKGALHNGNVLGGAVPSKPLMVATVGCPCAERDMFQCPPCCRPETGHYCHALEPKELGLNMKTLAYTGPLPPDWTRG